jgi:hypothetical protein
MIFLFVQLDQMFYLIKKSLTTKYINFTKCPISQVLKYVIISQIDQSIITMSIHMMDFSQMNISLIKNNQIINLDNLKNHDFLLVKACKFLYFKGLIPRNHFHE